jgi:hypothetical protein
MKKNETNQKTLIIITVLLCSIFFFTLSSNCGRDKKIQDAVKVWEAYVESVRAGRGEIAKSFFAKESQPYFEFDQKLQNSYLDTKFSIIKTEPQENFIKLQVLVEKKDGKQIALFRYLVNQGDKYLIQYPFLIFAKDWPEQKSPHFIIHRSRLSGGFLGSAIQNSTDFDPAVLENFYNKIKSLLNVDYPKPIDYYYCQNEEEVKELAGMRGVLWTNVGSAVITTQRYDFAEITYVLTNTMKKPIDLLYYGISGYAEFERARVEELDAKNLNFTIAKHFEKLGKNPILSLLESKESESEFQKHMDMFDVGGALIDYLVGTFGEDKFRNLYQNSLTNHEFLSQFRAIYNIDIVPVEEKLVNKYDRYFLGRPRGKVKGSE